MSKFNKGDKVSFTDKYDQHLKAEFVETKMVPAIDGEVERCIVLAYPFGDDMQVQCIVTEEALTLLPTKDQVS